MTKADRLFALLIVCAVISPFWFMASDITDGDEAEKTAVGVGLVGAIKATEKIVALMAGKS